VVHSIPISLLKWPGNPLIPFKSVITVVPIQLCCCLVFLRLFKRMSKDLGLNSHDSVLDCNISCIYVCGAKKADV
jgi:hypothetical protein